jgi:hypothetical protein
MARPNKAEAAWLRELQEVLDRCPSKRFGFYTIGDMDISVYDRTKDAKIYAEMDQRGDFCQAVDKFNAKFGELNFPFNVHSTAG